MSTKPDFSQPRTTFTGPTSYADAVDVLYDQEGEEYDGACVSLIGATHVAEFEWWGTDHGPRYVVALRELKQMTHFCDDPSRTEHVSVSVDVFAHLEDAQKFYAELVMTGAARWVEQLHRLD